MLLVGNKTKLIFNTTIVLMFYHMFYATVFSLSVLPDSDQVHIIVWGLVAFNRYTGAHIGIEVKGFPQQQVHRWMTGSYGCLQWTCRVTQYSKMIKDLKFQMARIQSNVVVLPLKTGNYVCKTNE